MKHSAFIASFNIHNSEKTAERAVITKRRVELTVTPQLRGRNGSSVKGTQLLALPDTQGLSPLNRQQQVQVSRLGILDPKEELEKGIGCKVQRRKCQVQAVAFRALRFSTVR